MIKAIASATQAQPAAQPTVVSQKSPQSKPQQPTAAVSIDGRQFVRLAGGRPMVGHAPQAIEYGGDEAVGTRIVENLNYVI